MDSLSWTEIVGAVCFGAVVGWITYRMLRRETGHSALSDLGAVVAAIGGSTVTTLYQDELFGLYAIGLFAGFFAYYIIGLIVGSYPANVLMKDT
jgi:uncharacterized membrane protein YeaQ/YmgE (transglycosylase-associated protein family)